MNLFSRFSKLSLELFYWNLQILPFCPKICKFCHFVQKSAMNWREGGKRGKAVNGRLEKLWFIHFCHLLSDSHDYISWYVDGCPHLDAPNSTIQIRIGGKTEAASGLCLQRVIILALSCVLMYLGIIEYIYINYHDNRIRDTTVAS